MSYVLAKRAALRVMDTKDPAFVSWCAEYIAVSTSANLTPAAMKMCPAHSISEHAGPRSFQFQERLQTWQTQIQCGTVPVGPRYVDWPILCPAGARGVSRTASAICIILDRVGFYGALIRNAALQQHVADLWITVAQRLLKPLIL